MANDDFPLKVGSKGPNVKTLQQGLGIDDDGVFGNGTKSAVIFKQRENNIEPENGEVNKAFFDVIIGTTVFDCDIENTSLPPSPDSPPEPGLIQSSTYISGDEPDQGESTTFTSSFGYQQIGDTLKLGNQLGGNVNSLQGSLNALGEATGIDFLTFDPFTIPTLDLRFALNLIGINLDEKLTEIRSSPGGSAALAQAQSQFRDKQTGKLAVPTTSSLNTSSLDPIKDFPTTIEFGFVTGKVVDSRTNEPLPGVKVRNPLLKKAETDINGRFTIQQPILPELLTDLGIISPSLFALTITLKKYTEPSS